MRLSILHEDISSKHLPQLQVVSKHLNISPEIIVKNLEEVDPQGKATAWLLKQLKDNKLIVPEDNHRIKTALEAFKQHQPRLPIKDINQYNSLYEVEEAIETVTGTGSKRSGSLQVNPKTLPGVKFINHIGELKLYKITNAKSLKELGEGTKWCTRKSYPDCQAKDYIDEFSYLYIITRDNKPFIQFTSDFGQVMDVNDEITSLKQYRLLLQPIEKEITSPESACEYARNVIGGRWPEAEPTIKKNQQWAYYYAKHIINGDESDGRIRWPEAEPYIMKSPYWAQQYAKHIIKGRWPEAE